MVRLPNKPYMKITRTMRLPELTLLLQQAEYIGDNEKIESIEVSGHLVIIHLE